MIVGKIDMYQYFLFKVYVDVVGLDMLVLVMFNKCVFDWLEVVVLVMMDVVGIVIGIILIFLGLIIWDVFVLVCKCNDEGVVIGVWYFGWFGLFVSLLLFDIDVLLCELIYVFDMFKVDGVILFINYGGKYFGDLLFCLLFEDLNWCKVVVFIYFNELFYVLVGLLL